MNHIVVQMAINIHGLLEIVYFQYSINHKILSTSIHNHDTALCKPTMFCLFDEQDRGKTAGVPTLTSLFLKD
jgi:hypothetical protein